MKLFPELKYLVFFGLLLSFFITVLLLVCFEGLSQWIYSACQSIAFQTSRVNFVLNIALLSLFALALIFFLVKFIFSSYKTTEKLSHYQTRLSKKLPKKIVSMINTFSVPQQAIILSKYNSVLAVTGGIFQPKIFLSNKLLKLLTTRELEAVILHEAYHWRRFHGLLFILAQAVSSSVGFLLPTLRDLSLRMRLEFESAADEYAIGYQGTDNHLVSALHKLAGQSDRFIPAFSAAKQFRLQLLHKSGTKLPSFSTTNLARSTLSVILISGAVFYSLTITIQSQATLQQLCLADTQCQSHCFTASADAKYSPKNSSTFFPASVF